MIEGRFHDGRHARAWAVTVALEDEVLVFHAGEPYRWPLAEIRSEVVDDQVRIARAGGDPARLNLALVDWRALSATAVRHHRAERRRHATLVVALAAVAAVAGAAVFVGVPAASGPLARHTPPGLERQIGQNLEDQVALAFPACGGQAGQQALADLGHRLGRAAGSPFDIRVRAVHAPMVNAFALPGGAIMVTDQLIDLTRSPDELSAVIAHEAAHVQKRHVMQGVWRSFGFGVVLDALVGGGTGAGQQAVLLLGSASNLRYSRAAEAQADAGGQALLVRLGLSSEGMAPFFQRLVATSQGRYADRVQELISDHPDTLRRAAASRARARAGAPAFTPDQWRAIRAACDDGYDPLRKIRKIL